MRKKKLFIVAIIPARSGSKGLRNKNIQKINNQPLLYYAIKDAKKCNLIDKIVVSTDSKKIQKIAIKLGADAPFLRPKHLSGDKIPSNPVLTDAIKKLEIIYEKKIDIIVYLQATEIFREKWMIEKCIYTLIKNKKYDSAFVAYKTHKNFWYLDKKNRPMRLNKNYDLVRQNRSMLYREDTGLACASRREVILSGKRIGNKVKIIPHQYELGTLDIHNLNDLKLIKKIKKVIK